MLSKIKPKKVLYGTVLIIVLFSTGVAAAFLYTRYSWAVSFRQYTPAYLPVGVYETGKEVEIWRTKSINPFDTHRIFRIDYGGGSLAYLSQEEVDKLHPVECVGNGKELGILYVETSTQVGQPYCIKTVTYQTTGRKEQRISLVKDGTYIWMYTDGELAEEEWSKIIDSLTQVQYKKLPTHLYYPGP